MEEKRSKWLNALQKIAMPVLEALEAEQLKERMPLEFHSDRAAYAPLEALGRTLLGVSPFLELEEVPKEEQEIQKKMRKLAVEAIDKATDPKSKDYMVFDEGGQPLVDAAFLSHALVRAPSHLAGELPERVKRNLIDALKRTRAITACNTNWIFFSAMVEAGLHVLGEAYDPMRVVYALRAFDDWYVGDGMYGDGKWFHFDYYNSFVIQPMYVDLCDFFADRIPEAGAMREKVIKRATRYAAILERLIGPDGSYPIVGRSICYRFGAFQMLSQAALQHRLPEELSPAGVRCALTEVLCRTMAFPEMFDKNGWLQPGIAGYQPELAEGYINVGSLYLCTAFFLPLGLPKEDPFWNDPDEEWSARKVWNGKKIAIDHAVE
ncbi:MAG: DUF2264 domain-containing protein [Fusicatenibacter sp.]